MTLSFSRKGSPITQEEAQEEAREKAQEEARERAQEETREKAQEKAQEEAQRQPSSCSTSALAIRAPSQHFP